MVSISLLWANIRIQGWPANRMDTVYYCSELISRWAYVVHSESSGSFRHISMKILLVAKGIVCASLILFKLVRFL